MTQQVAPPAIHVSTFASQWVLGQVPSTTIAPSWSVFGSDGGVRLDTYYVKYYSPAVLCENRGRDEGAAWAPGEAPFADHYSPVLQRPPTT
jgi:hypothetical protein